MCHIPPAGLLATSCQFHRRSRLAQSHLFDSILITYLSMEREKRPLFMISCLIPVSIISLFFALSLFSCLSLGLTQLITSLGLPCDISPIYSLNIPFSRSPVLCTLSLDPPLPPSFSVCNLSFVLPLALRLSLS